MLNKWGQTRLSIPFILGCLLLLGASVAQADTWRCTKPDGSVVYSDQNLSGQCQKLEDLPPLLRVPSVVPPQPGEASPEVTPPAPPEPEQVPTPGRGRRIDPPDNAMITIRDVKATGNFNSGASSTGMAFYNATMLVENGDSNWTAERVCINVRFRDVNMIFLDVQQVGCVEDLKPFDTRSLTVTYSGLTIRSFPVQAEAKVDYVKWTK
jgi:Domain of unknown function (DUF4124)